MYYTTLKGSGKVILFRALNPEDEKNFSKNETIISSLIYSYFNLDNSLIVNDKDKVLNFYNKCFNLNQKEELLRLICGHVNGKLVNAKRSPWISTTSNFKSAYDYAKLDKCKGNLIRRRQVICFEVNDDMIINTAEECQNNNFSIGMVLNLTDNRLALYRKAGIVVSYDTTNIPEAAKRGSNFSFSNYAIKDNEYLVVGLIKPSNYILLTPEEQDFLLEEYGTGIMKYFEEKINYTKVKTLHK
mgnify:CR=1 FL=1